MLPTITVDVGTTSVKLGLFDADSSVRASQRHATPVERDSEGDVYDIPAITDLIAQFIAGLDSDLRATVKRIVLTGVGESGGLIREDGSLASPMIVWHDQRGARYLQGLTAAEQARIYQITGLPVNANYSLSKVVWAINNAGGTRDSGTRWLNIVEYVAALMTGRRWSEPSLASRTLALDIERRAWSAEVCALVGLDPAVFPDLVDAASGAEVLPDYAARVGVSSEVRVHVAGHDHMVGAVGADLQPGELLNSTGTTEGLLFLRDQPSLDQRTAAAKLANGIACRGSGFTLFASIPTGGSAFATVQSMFGLREDQLAARLAQLHHRYLEGSIRLENIPVVLPWFRGSPVPQKQASARGAIAGISTDTTIDDLIFGCFLGLAAQFCDVLDLFHAVPTRVKVIGPASKNPLWLQVKADLLGVPLTVSQFPEVVSRGAQALASDASSTWALNEPQDVRVDSSRHTRLSEWRDSIAPQWTHLTGVPHGR